MYVKEVMETSDKWKYYSHIFSQYVVGKIMRISKVIYKIICTFNITKYFSSLSHPSKVSRL